MKRCLHCDSHFPASDNACSVCAWHPDILHGFPAYASTFQEQSAGFKASYFSELARLEEQNFWFRARNKLIVWALKNYYPDFSTFLEIGCGTGFVLSGIKQVFPDRKLYGSELFADGLTFAAARQPAIDFMQMDARNIPFTEEFSCIGAFDVLEHIEEDEKVLAQIHHALKDRGMMVLTVPQHKWLWSPADEYACHVRRYTASELHTKIAQAGFDILRSTSFVSSLLPAMFISRFLQKRIQSPKNPGMAELEINSILNAIFEKMLSFEIKLIQAGINFPAGGSRLIIAQKGSK